MSETANVRVVRCPNCENLLPEVTDFSVYQCGGCGAVLRCNSLLSLSLEFISYYCLCNVVVGKDLGFLEFTCCLD